MCVRGWPGGEVEHGGRLAGAGEVTNEAGRWLVARTDTVGREHVLLTMDTWCVQQLQL